MAYNSFPYVSMHELNLDYLLNKSKEVQSNVEAAAGSASSAASSATAAAGSADAALTYSRNAANSAASAEASAADSIEASRLAVAAAGDPVTFTATSQLTDTSKIYVYIGETSTYTYGHWYYYAGGAWIDGGVYGTWTTDDALSESSTNAVQNKVIKDVVNSLSNISDLVGFTLEANNYQSGAYSQSGVVANTSRAYCIYTGVNKGSKLFFDNTKWTVSYYYITSESDFTPIHTPNVWDDTGEITLNYMDNGIVFVAVRAGVTNISNRMNEINNTVYLFNNVDDSGYLKYHGVVSGTTIESNNKPGFYAVGGSSTQIVSNMTDMPVDDFNGGILVNRFVGSAGTTLYQTLIEIDSGTIRGRNFTRTSGGNWSGIGTINWLAFGDSITHGSYSTQTGQTLNDYRYGYAYRTAKNLKRNAVYKFYNCAVRGIGWVNTGNNGETFDDMMALYTGDKTQITLVTIQLGINDYNSSELLGTTESAENDGTISGAIRYGLRYLCENYPNAKIVAISPLNSRNHGNASNGWSRNTRLTRPGTLQNVCDMIAYWCDVYNVTYVNEISQSFLNNYNITNFLGDNLHPTSDGQWMLAKDIAAKVFY